jgi:hypothetical protein
VNTVKKEESGDWRREGLLFDFCRRGFGILNRGRVKRRRRLEG